MTPNDHRPRECKWHSNGMCELEEIVWGYPYKCSMNVNCPDYQPKEKKDNDSRTTENN